MLFNIFINDTENEMECTLSRSVDDTKLSSATDTTEGEDAIQRDLNKTNNWPQVTFMRFNKAKCCT